MEEDLRLSFVCLVLFHLSGKPWAKGGVLTRDLAQRLTAPIGLACPHQPRLPPPVSPAPTSLTCPHRPRLPLSASLAPMAKRTAWHWYLALGFPSLSFIYKSIVFLLFVSTDNSSTSHLLHHLLVSTRTGIYLGGRWRNPTALSLRGSGRSILRSIFGQVYQKPCSVTPILFLFLSLG